MLYNIDYLNIFGHITSCWKCAQQQALKMHRTLSFRHDKYLSFFKTNFFSYHLELTDNVISYSFKLIFEYEIWNCCFRPKCYKQYPLSKSMRETICALFNNFLESWSTIKLNLFLKKKSLSISVMKWKFKCEFVSFKLPLKEHSGIFIPLAAFFESYVNVTFHINF